MRVGAIGSGAVLIGNVLSQPLRRAVRSPLVKSLLRRAYDHYFAAASGEVRLFRGIYPDFAAAARAAIAAGTPVGFDNPESAFRVAEERRRIFDCDYPMLFWLGRRLPDVRRIFDLGGNVGISYYAWRRYLSYPEELDWLVCDVPAVVAAGEQILRDEGVPGLRFTTDYAELGAADLLIAAGALQFIDDPFTPLERAQALPRHVLLNKTPLYEREDAVTLQGMGTAVCPYHLFNRAGFHARFERLGYRLVDEWTTPALGARIPFHSEYDVPAFSGCYLVRE
jgi:putative methyltransferase (TIGR04325 family)